jgi:hypothetical protein
MDKLEPQQPVEGELAECPSRNDCGLHTPKCRPSCEIRVALGAQRAHMIAKGYHLPNDCCLGCDIKAECDYVMAAEDYVKLPSEEEFAEMLRLATEKALVKNKLGMVDNFNSIARALRELLKEVKP